jgi:hypothetical protein
MGMLMSGDDEYWDFTWSILCKAQSEQKLKKEIWKSLRNLNRPEDKLKS